MEDGEMVDREGNGLRRGRGGRGDPKELAGLTGGGEGRDERLTGLSGGGGGWNERLSGLSGGGRGLKGGD